MPYGASHHSSFLITINSNRQPKSEEERRVIANSLRDVIGGKLFEQKHFLRMIKFLKGRREASLIKNMDAEFAIETGSNQHRVHAHVLVNVYHNSTIHLDPIYIKDFVTRKLNQDLVKAGFKPIRGSVYVNIRAVKGGWSVLKYVRKKGKS